MGMITTYARCVRIHEIPGCNPPVVKADVLISDGVIEHYDWNNHRHRKEIMKLVDYRTYFKDEREDASWESLCKFYGANL